MDFKIEIDGADADMTFEKAESILNNIYLSLVVEQGSFFQNTNFGSRLHLIRGKNTDNTEILVKEYCKESLEWLITTGRATAVDVITERNMEIDLHLLKILITVTQANGQQIVFETFLEIV